MKYSCDYCLSTDSKPSAECKTVSGGMICGLCSVGELHENESWLEVSYRDDIGHSHAYQVLPRTPETPSYELNFGQLYRWKDMSFQLMKVHGMIN